MKAITSDFPEWCLNARLQAAAISLTLSLLLMLSIFFIYLIPFLPGKLGRTGNVFLRYRASPYIHALVLYLFATPGHDRKGSSVFIVCLPFLGRTGIIAIRIRGDVVRIHVTWGTIAIIRITAKTRVPAFRPFFQPEFPASAATVLMPGLSGDFRILTTILALFVFVAKFLWMLLNTVLQ